MLDVCLAITDRDMSVTSVGFYSAFDSDYFVL